MDWLLNYFGPPLPTSIVFTEVAAKRNLLMVGKNFNQIE